MADVFDLDPLDPGMENMAQDLLNVNIQYKAKDRKESIEELKKDQEALDKLEDECKDKLETKECQAKLLEYASIYEIKPSLEFFDQVQDKIDELIKKAEKKAEGKEEGAEGEAAPEDGAAPPADATPPPPA